MYSEPFLWEIEMACLARKMWEARKAPTSPWLVVLATIAMLDLGITVLGIIRGHFAEANPALNFVLTRCGLGEFIITKTIFVVWPIAFMGALPWCWDETRRKQIGDKFTIVAVVLYLAILASSVLMQFFASDLLLKLQ